MGDRRLLAVPDGREVDALIVYERAGGVTAEDRRRIDAAELAGPSGG